MDSILQLLHYLLSFAVVLSVIVFVHEMGHYLVARACGVKIEAFSIGFGKEIKGWYDKHGTRWKISALPLGGYVKMYGDASAASNADEDMLEHLSEEEKQKTFHFKPLWQKAAVVAAGPAANFLLTIIILTAFMITTGLPSNEPVVGDVLPDTPAAAAGLKSSDRVVKVGDKTMRRFNDIPFALSTNLGTPIELEILRDGTPMKMTITPASISEEDGLGNTIQRPMIGIKSTEIRYEEVGLGRAMAEAVSRTYAMCAITLEAIGQMVRGERGLSELKGPVGIAKLSGQAADKGAVTIFWLIAMLSANLGLVNLFPIPLLDGGHLAYYTAEALRGRPLAQKVQEYGYRLGFALIITLMAFTLYNDIRNLLFS